MSIFSSIKEKKYVIVFFMILVLIAIVSFCIGYLNAKETSLTPIIIEKCGEK